MAAPELHVFPDVEPPSQEVESAQVCRKPFDNSPPSVGGHCPGPEVYFGVGCGVGLEALRPFAMRWMGAGARRANSAGAKAANSSPATASLRFIRDLQEAIAHNAQVRLILYSSMDLIEYSKPNKTGFEAFYFTERHEERKRSRA